MIQARVVHTGRELRTRKMVRNILLVCGILSSVLYVGADIVAAMSWHSYSYTSQSISELFAIGSPTRWIFALIPYISSFSIRNAPLREALHHCKRLDRGDAWRHLLGADYNSKLVDISSPIDNPRNVTFPPDSSAATPPGTGSVIPG